MRDGNISKINMINTKGEEEKREFALKAHTNKFEYYRAVTKFNEQSKQDPFAALLIFVGTVFEKCVSGISIEGFEGNYPQLIEIFFKNDPEALDILVAELMDFHKPSIKR